MSAPLKPGTDEDWDWVAPIAARILHAAGDPSLLTDVRAKAHLLVGRGEFVIFRLDSTCAERALWVWIAYGRGRDFVRRHMGQIAWIARECGAVAIRFNSHRLGFTRTLGPQWRVKNVTYEWRFVDGQ